MGKDERKRRQKERVGYNSRWMVEIIISSFKWLLGEALRAMKPEYIMIEVATKIVCITRPGPSWARLYGEAETLAHAPSGD